MIPFPIICTSIAQNNAAKFFASASLFSRWTDLAGQIGQFSAGGLLIWINWSRRAVFCPMKTTRVAVVFAVVVGAPVRRFSGMTILAKFSTYE